MHGIIPSCTRNQQASEPGYLDWEPRYCGYERAEKGDWRILGDRWKGGVECDKQSREALSGVTYLVVNEENTILSVSKIEFSLSSRRMHVWTVRLPCLAKGSNRQTEQELRSQIKPSVNKYISHFIVHSISKLPNYKYCHCLSACLKHTNTRDRTLLYQPIAMLPNLYWCDHDAIPPTKIPIPT